MRPAIEKQKEYLQELFAKSFSGSKYSVQFLFASIHGYENLINYIPYRFSKNACDYNSKYNKISDTDTLECHIIFLENNQIIAITPLNISMETADFSSNGEAILIPYLVSGKDAKDYDDLFITFFESILDSWKKSGSHGIAFQEYEQSLSVRVVNYLLAQKFTYFSREVFMKSCQGDQKDLWVDIRKSYKSYINKGLRELTTKVLTGPEAMETFLAFQKLHAQVSGRITRSPETWIFQREETLIGSAFLSCIFENEELVGCSFVPHNSCSALYAVGAYRRDRPNLHLGHISQWLSIANLNAIGIPKYRLGHLGLSTESLSTPKEISIAHFKKGFSNQIGYERQFNLSR